MSTRTYISWALLLLMLISSSCFAADVTVTANGNLTFSPASVTINKGDTVTFKNSGSLGHNVIATDGSFCCSTTCKTGQTSCALAGNFSSTMTFSTPGTFGYFCSAHGTPTSGMHGSITVNDTAPPPPTTAITNATSGLWYDPLQSGHGFMVEILPNNVFLAVWFTFTPAGDAQNWLYIQGNYTTGSNTITIAPVAGNARSGVLLNTGGAFPPNFVSSNVTTTQWGTMTFTFNDCNSATVNWHSLLPNYPDGSMNLQRLTGVAGLTCQ